MFGSTILEVAIGVAFVYLLLSMICSALNEMLAGAFRMRARNLQEGLRNLMNDPGGTLVGRLYDHALIRGFTPRLKRPTALPSYISARVFSVALLDLLAPADPTKGPKTVADLKAAVASLPNAHLKQALSAIIDEAGDDLERIRKGIARWFDDAMERVSGWYRRQAHRILLLLAFGVTAVLNVDTIVIGNQLARDNALRAAVVAGAQAMVQRPQGDTTVSPATIVGEVRRELQNLQLPIGWTVQDGRRFPADRAGWLAKAAGLLLTTVAVSLGAPFWFDVVTRLAKVNLRSGGPRPEPEKS